MSWGGVDAIVLLSGESAEQAIDRLYGGAPESDTTKVSRDQHAWMMRVQRLLEELAPGWILEGRHIEPGRRWPWYCKLVHPSAPMWVELYRDVVTFRYLKGYGPADDDEWRFWWRTLRRCVALPALIYEGDGDEIVNTRMSATAAREYYNWF